MIEYRKVFLNPIFFIGLFLRIAFIVFSSPNIINEWYSPFLENSISNFSFDPWSHWIESNGNPEAFPYGYSMWLVFAPFIFLCEVFNLKAAFGYVFVLLLADVFMLCILLKLINNVKITLLTYWLSPVIIIATYGLGLNDLIPVLMLTIAILLFKNNKVFASSAFLLFSISAKLSMVVALPFFLIYILNNKSRSHHIKNFLVGLFIFFTLLWVPFLLSESAMLMLFGNQEMGKVFDFALKLGNTNTIFIVPLFYLCLLYLGWRIKPLNFELFTILIAVSFMSLVLLTPSSPGWLIWAIPFLVIYQARGDLVAILLILLFSILYLFNILFEMPIDFIYELKISDIFITSQDNYFLNFILMLSNTSMFAIGFLIAYRMWRDEIVQSNFFRFNKKPLVLGIAGDSGSGKDTLSDAIEGLFGSHSSVKLSGDDYHRWDRHKPMWKVMTHINPMANDLQAFSNDLFSLRDGKSINQRHYDHKTGKMTKHFKVKSNRFIMVSGLHTFSLPLIREACDLKVYLDIDEQLRRFFKIKRDVTQRGHSLEKVISSLEAREKDSQNFIRPQRDHADLIMSLEPLNKDMLVIDNDIESLRLKLSLIIRNSYNELSLQRVLIGVLGLHVDLTSNNDGSEVSMQIQGECSAEDIQQAALILSPITLEYLDENPKWEGGMLGLMQIVIFSQISQLITKSTSK